MKLLAFTPMALALSVAAAHAQDQRVAGFPDDPSHSGGNNYAFTVNGVGKWYAIPGDAVMANTMATKVEMNILEHKRDARLGWIEFYADCSDTVTIHGGTKACRVHDID